MKIVRFFFIFQESRERIEIIVEHALKSNIDNAMATKENQVAMVMVMANGIFSCDRL